MDQLFDPNTTTLRDRWTEADFQYLKSKERYVAYLAVLALPGRVGIGLERYWVDWMLIEQRQFSDADMIDGFLHPRDLPLTGKAYMSLREAVESFVASGGYTLPSDWRTRFPDLSLFYDGVEPPRESYPIR